MSELNIRENVILKNYTTMRCGGPARYFAEPSGTDGLIEAFNFAAKNNLKVFVLGMGSNILVSDKGFDGLVIRFGKKMGDIDIQNGRIRAKAGATLASFGNRAAAQGLAGAEFACGIPGSVGGAVFMNAGAYGRELSDICVSVTYWDGYDIKTIDKDMCDFGYRQSFFSKEDGAVVLECCCELEPGDKTKILEYIDELRTKRTTSQPLDVPSSGSTFKRPTGYFAGKLIEDSGLRGFKLDESGAQVSPKHCGFVVNNGGTASASDVLRLINYVSDKVFEDSGVRLEREVRLVGEF